MNAANSIPVAIDVIIVVLLIATIAYAIVLNRKLAVLRDAKAEMEVLLARFADSTAKAESGIRSLKAHAGESGATLDTMTSRAKALADDLTFLIEKGTSLANRLEEAVGSARAKGGGAARTGAAATDRTRAIGAANPPSAKAARETEASPEEAALLKALRGVR